MNPEDRRLILKAIELGEENNVILRRLQRANHWGVFFKILYWVVIIGISFGAYIFLQPYIDIIKNGYGTFTSGIQTVENIRESILSPKVTPKITTPVKTTTTK